MSLFLPDGSPTEHWLLVAGIDSDVFRKAQSEQNRVTLDLSDQKDEGTITEDQAEELFELSRTHLLSATILDWSFDSECTEETKVELLTEAPQIATAINLFVGSRKSFFKNGSKGSTTSQPNNTSSKAESKDPNPQSEATSNQ